MSTKVSLDTSTLRSAASRVNGISSNLESELSTLEQIIQSTANAWEGDAKVAFENTFRTTYKKNLTEIKNSLLQYAKAMNAYADDLDNATQRGSRRFSSI